MGGSYAFGSPRQQLKHFFTDFVPETLAPETGPRNTDHLEDIQYIDPNFHDPKKLDYNSSEVFKNFLVSFISQIA